MKPDTLNTPVLRRLRIGSCRAFSLIEIMVSVTLLSVIIVGLLAMFYHVQRAFRGGMTQVDVMESGRSFMRSLTLEMQEMAAVEAVDYTNFMSVVAAGYTATTQKLPNGGTRNNEIHDLTFLSRHNDEWTGIAYRVGDVNWGVGMLYRYQYATNSMTNAWRVSDNVFNSSIARGGFMPAIDGVVHFQIEAYDAAGNIMTNAFYPNITNPVGYACTNNILPAYLDIELGVLEDKTLARFRARAESDVPAARAYLEDRAGQVHLFRQRVHIRPGARLALK